MNASYPPEKFPCVLLLLFLLLLLLLLFLSSTATLQFKGSYKVPETNAGGDLHA